MPPRIELVEKWTELQSQEEQREAITKRQLEAQKRAELADSCNETTTTTTTTIKTTAAESGDTVKPFKQEIVWRNVVLMSALHLGALMGLRQCFVSAQWKTVALAYLLYMMGGIGITAGAHRLWSHRSYRAKWPYRLIVAAFNTMAFENSIYEWTRDHRAHHKYAETDADPHDIRRGFFFAHVGWLLCRKHPAVREKGKLIDLSDLVADPIVRFQHRHYLPCVAVACFVVPTLLPHLLWGESLYNSFYICALLRYVVTLHGTWFVNSIAHMWGRQPYDKTQNATENRGVSFGALGEGFHNYHHAFPWDYAASELGYDTNLTKLFIDFFATFGWVYERKVASPSMIKQRKLRTGDVAEMGPYGPHNY